MQNLNYILKDIINKIDEGVLVIDKNYKITYANKTALRIFGSNRRIENLKCHELFHHLSVPCHEIYDVATCPNDEVLREGKISSTDRRYVINNGSRNFFNIKTSYVTDQRGDIKIIKILSDVTAHKIREEIEKKLEQTKEAFFHMLKDLDTAYKDTRGVYNDLVITLSNVIDAKSPWTQSHSTKAADYATAIARAMELDDHEIETLRIAALLHDIGKIGTYDMILDKPGKLDDLELSLMREHTIKGEEILKHVKGLRKMLPVIRSHHENMDGTGYPDGLRGGEIPLLARILCVADAYDAMMSERPYRSALGPEYAMTELEYCSEKQFDPDVVNAFLSLLEKEEPALCHSCNDAA